MWCLAACISCNLWFYVVGYFYWCFWVDGWLVVLLVFGFAVAVIAGFVGLGCCFQGCLLHLFGGLGGGFGFLVVAWF